MSVTSKKEVIQSHKKGVRKGEPFKGWYMNHTLYRIYNYKTGRKAGCRRKGKIPFGTSVLGPGQGQGQDTVNFQLYSNFQ